MTSHRYGAYISDASYGRIWVCSDDAFSGQGETGEKGNIEADVAFTLLLGSVVLLAFWSAGSVELLGGILAGTAAVLVGYIWHKHRSIELRFYDPLEPIRAEGMSWGTALEVIQHGTSVVRVGIRTRFPGQQLNVVGIRFYNGTPNNPFRFGNRIKQRNEIEVIRCWWLHRDGDSNWIADPITVEHSDDDGYYVSKGIRIRALGRQMFDFELKTDAALFLKGGMISFQIEYERDGNNDISRVRNVICVGNTRRRTLIRHRMQSKQSTPGTVDPRTGVIV